VGGSHTCIAGWSSVLVLFTTIHLHHLACTQTDSKVLRLQYFYILETEFLKMELTDLKMFTLLITKLFITRDDSLRNKNLNICSWTCSEPTTFLAIKVVALSFLCIWY
jgi:hypothetical protein